MRVLSALITGCMQTTAIYPSDAGVLNAEGAKRFICSKELNAAEGAIWVDA